MITDARVLRTGFVPREVEHRDAEVTHLTEILSPLADGNPADATLLLSPSGVGKTCLSSTPPSSSARRSSTSSTST